MMFGDSGEHVTFFSMFPISVPSLVLSTRNALIWAVLVLRRQGRVFLSCTACRVTPRSCTSVHLTVCAVLLRKGGLNKPVSTTSDPLGPWVFMMMTLGICDGAAGLQEEQDSCFCVIHSCAQPPVTVPSRPPKSRIVCRAKEQRPCSVFVVGPA